MVHCGACCMPVMMSADMHDHRKACGWEEACPRSRLNLEHNPCSGEPSTAVFAPCQSKQLMIVEECNSDKDGKASGPQRQKCWPIRGYVMCTWG